MNDESQNNDEQQSEFEVLKMLSEGKISIEEAESLLKQLSNERLDSTTAVEPYQEPTDPRKLKYLRVTVHDEDSNVDVRVPLKLVMLGAKLDGIAGGVGSDVLSESGIDLGKLSSLSEEDFYDAIAGLKVDVVDGDSTVRVFCE